MDDGRVVFSIEGDNRPLRQALSETTSAIDRESHKWDDAVEDSSQNMTASFTKAFNVERVKNFAIEAGKALLKFGKEAIDAASDLAEVQNVVDVTFGENANQIEAWAKKAGDQFGLTETQAKKFTSTIGAMAKSMGIAEPEIVSMSTDLAGLAADMASFYNLDFEEAFQKLRSGLSGQTEPLKALGINMSEATLNAFALKQGLEKTFSEMSQGEQTLLRYQYIMQATADAQGDFARTSDGYANAMRKMETQIESLKTKFGEVLLPVVESAVNSISGMITKLTTPVQRTVLDDFAKIDLETSGKLHDIEETATQARDLINILDQINTYTFTDNGAAQVVGDIADSANKLTITKPGIWEGLIETLNGADIGLDAADAENVNGVADGANALKYGADGKWSALKDAVNEIDIKNRLDGDGLKKTAEGANTLETAAPGRWSNLMTALGNMGALSGLESAGTNIESLSNAINSDGASTEKAGAWITLLDALAADSDALTGLTGESAEETKKWLENLAAGANALNPASAQGWEDLKKTFMEGFTGGEGADTMDGLFGASSEYAEMLNALGIDASEAADAHQLWLTVCRQLVSTIPGLSSIVNTETGEVAGGTEALKQYVAEWEESERRLALLNDISKRREALKNQFDDRYSLEAEMLVAQSRAERARAEFEAKYGSYDAAAVLVESSAGNDRRTSYEKELASAYNETKAAADAATEAQAKYDKYIDDYNAALEKLTEQEQAVNDAYGETAMAEAEAASGMYLTGEAAETATANLTALGDKLKEIADYYETARDSTESMVRSVVDGFGEIESPAEKARREATDLKKQLTELGKSEYEINISMADATKDIPTAASMLKGLQDQVEYMDEYQRRLTQARAMGFSEEMLASLSDGSLESYDYLDAMTKATGDQVAQINEAYAAAEAGKEQFTDTLTQQRLAADEVFQGLVDDANAMINELDLADGAQDAMSSTLQGMIDGIAAQLPGLTSEVDAVVEQIERLNALSGFSFIGGSILSNVFGAGGLLNFTLDGSNASGLDYVPFDGYLSELHEGESVLTAAEAEIWRNFKYGSINSANSIDYDALGATMRDNVNAGGNVYLDGRSVGRVISASQANSYRNLERSGWQG